MTILGTRPEIIRLSQIIPKLDEYCDHTLVHTGQNYDKNLNEIFFSQLNVREPDIFLNIKSQTFGNQAGQIIEKAEEILKKINPKYLIILGDVNSGLSCIPAERLGIQTIHLEAGNRCYDLRVPEEINRKIIDHTSTWNLPYTQKSKNNLLREGIKNDKIFISGNPIKEVIDFYKSKWENSDILNTLHVNSKSYFLVTAHRAENVDIESRLKGIINGISEISKIYTMPVVCSIHPRTKSKLKDFNIIPENEKIKFCDPFSLFDFLKLEKNALCTITDSGTVQEECCILNTPSVTIRDTTERPETLECGSNILASVVPERIVRSTKVMIENDKEWDIPEGYNVKDVSSRVLKFINGLN
jgi:UDP-N-acetylglucosamine 2-epimerase (non-hydrolysing)